MSCEYKILPTTYIQGRRSCRCVECNGKAQPYETARRHESKRRWHAIQNDEQLLNDHNDINGNDVDELPNVVPLHAYASQLQPQEVISVGMMDLIAGNEISETAAVKSCKVFKQALTPVLDAKYVDLDIPVSLHTLKKNHPLLFGEESKEFKSQIAEGYDLYFICEKCSKVVDGQDGITCECGATVHANADRNKMVLICDVVKQVETAMGQLKTAKSHHWCVERETGDGDIWDALLRDKSDHEKLNVVYVMTCTDGTVFRQTTGTSYTPFVGQWLNQQPGHRHSHEGPLLFGLFPPGVKDYRPLFRFVFDKLKNSNFLADGSCTGVQVQKIHI